MKLIRAWQKIQPAEQATVVALGNFDGLHLGHQAIIGSAVLQAKAMGVPAAVITFEPHPRSFFEPQKPRLRLMRIRDKITQLKALEISRLFILRFNAELAQMSADVFVRELLVRNLRVKHIVTGHDFCFGKNRQGNNAFLEAAAKQYGFGLSTLQAVMKNDQVISSSAIRQALGEGDIEKAGWMLGNNFSLSGHVQHGHKRGGMIGFPTANLSMRQLFIPRKGVYAVYATIEGLSYKAVANLGVKPTFGIHEPVLEVHLLDFNQSIYGKRMQVEFIHFIRDEICFDDVSQLKEQIEKDINVAQNILTSLPS